MPKLLGPTADPSGEEAWGRAEIEFIYSIVFDIIGVRIRIDYALAELRYRAGPEATHTAQHIICDSVSIGLLVEANGVYSIECFNK